MKIYFTTDGSIDHNLMQICPFKETHKDIGYDNEIKKVGCGGCQSCKWCYGKHIYPEYKEEYALYPHEKLPLNTHDWAWNGGINGYSNALNEQTDMGLSQFVMKPMEYVCCAQVYTEKGRKNLSLQIKWWWYQNVILSWEKLSDKISWKWYHLKSKFEK